MKPYSNIYGRLRGEFIAVLRLVSRGRDVRPSNSRASVAAAVLRSVFFAFTCSLQERYNSNPLRVSVSVFVSVSVSVTFDSADSYFSTVVCSWVHKFYSSSSRIWKIRKTLVPARTFATFCHKILPALLRNPNSQASPPRLLCMEVCVKRELLYCILVFV